MHHRASPDRASRRSRSTRSTPRASAATSSRSRPTRASSWGRWTSPTSTPSRASRRRSRSTRRRPRATRARRSAPSPRCTTTCACCSRASASRTARSAAGRSPASRPSRSSTRCWRCPRARASRSTRRSCAGARASTATCSRACAARASRASRVDGETYLLDEVPALDKKFKHDIAAVVDRLVIKDDLRQRLTDSIETALRIGDGLVEVREVDGPVHTYSEKFACPEHGVSLRRARAAHVLVQLAARRLPGLHGPRRDARGRPRARRARPGAVDPRRRARALERLGLELLRAGARGDRRPLGGAARPALGRALRRASRSVPERHGRRARVRDVQEPLRAQALVHDGLRGRRREPPAALPRDRSRSCRRSASRRSCRCARARPAAARACGPSRSRSRSAGTTSTTSRAARCTRRCAYFRDLELTDTERLIAERVIREIRERLTFLDDVGVGYLTLDRAARTLSGGEAQRIRLATQIGASLVGVLYILDEPSIGLHQRDNARLIAHARAAARHRQHGDRRRARRGDDARGRLGDRHGPGRRRCTAARSSPRARPTDIAAGRRRRSRAST